jgi:hypothetical protein
MKAVTTKLREVLAAVVPIDVLVLVFHFLIEPFPSEILWRFLLGSLFTVVGLTLFLVGADLGVTPVGELVGQRVARTNKILIVIVVTMVLGFLVSIAEPDLLVLAYTIEETTGGGIATIAVILFVSIGVGVFVMLGLVRILFRIPLYILLAIVYPVIGLFCLLVRPELIPIAFDASGATTGALTVPFILSLSAGVAVLHLHGKSAEKDSFGLVALASAGAIIGFLLLAMTMGSDVIDVVASDPATQNGILAPFASQIGGTALESLIAFLPIVILFLVGDIFFFRLLPRAFLRIVTGLVFAYAGLVLFLTGVSAGFMDAGQLIGSILPDRSRFLLYLFSFLLGFLVVMAEPAVSILTHRIEEVTAGSIRRRIVAGALAVGVGFALVLNAVRILVPDMRLWHILLPGYAVAVALMFFTPKLFIGIGFDAGGVASGPISATFVLAFSQGIAFGEATGNLDDVFGMIALIALTPIIAIETVGILYRIQTRERKVRPHA